METEQHESRKPRQTPKPKSSGHRQRKQQLAQVLLFGQDGEPNHGIVQREQHQESAPNFFATRKEQGRDPQQMKVGQPSRQIIKAPVVKRQSPRQPALAEHG